MDASQFVHVVEDRQGYKIGCVEEIAWRAGWIDDDTFARLGDELVKSGYGAYIHDVPGARAGPAADARSSRCRSRAPTSSRRASSPTSAGVFLESFRGDQLAEHLGHRPDIVQTNVSVSARGTVRGIHFADVPPGQGKYVTVLRRLARRLRRRHPGRLADLRAVGGRHPRRRRPPGGLPLRGPGPRLLRARGRHDRDVPVHGHLQPRRPSTASTRSTPRSGSCCRPASSRCCHPRTTPHPRSRMPWRPAGCPTSAGCAAWAAELAQRGN